MTFFKSLGANAGFLDRSPLDLIFKIVTILEDCWLGSHIIVDPSSASGFDVLLPILRPPFC